MDLEREVQRIINKLYKKDLINFVSRKLFEDVQLFPQFLEKIQNLHLIKELLEINIEITQIYLRQKNSLLL